MKGSFDQKNLPTTLALIVALVIILASVVVASLPNDKGAAEVARLKKAASDAEFKGRLANKQSASMQQASLKLTWTGTGDEIGPAAYSNLNNIATATKVSIVNFRPQRAVNAGDLTQLPFVINITGQYTNVLNFVRQIETTPSKLSVELLQIGASDDSTDTVAATIGVEAYVINSAPPSPKSSTKAVTSKKPMTSTPVTTISAHPKAIQSGKTP